MDPEKNLIFIKGEDKTEQINCLESYNGKWRVIYCKNSKAYNYIYTNILWKKNPTVINSNTCVIYDNNLPVTSIVKILDFGDYVRLIFKTGYKRLYPRAGIFIEESCLSNKTGYNCFEYLKKLSYQVSIKTDDGISFLSKQYSKLNVISPRSVLASYLEGKPLIKDNILIEPIFPFGFNLSQKNATKKALTSHISVIEGPPGTGKTQTILNIIANAIIDNKTVAVVSNNNSATANILEKLQKYDLDFIAAYLGNKANKKDFFDNPKNTYPNMNKWILSEDEIELIKTNLVSSQKELDEMLKYQNEQAILKQELSKIKTEYQYFNKYYIESMMHTIQFGSIYTISSDKILSLMLDYQRNIEYKNISFVGKLYNLFVYGIYSFRFYKNSPEVIISFLQKMFYDKKIEELNKEIDSLANSLDKYNFDSAMKEYSENSMKLFKAKLTQRYKTGGNRDVLSEASLWKSFGAFINEYPVILSTTHSLRSCASENYLFDYVIMDEASQVDLVTGALALSCAKNAVIVGDVKQLPNVVTNEVAKNTKQIFEAYNLDDAYSYVDNSLLSSITKLYKDVPKTLLKEHYRCHSKIIGFCNQKFYNNELIILTQVRDNDKPLVLYKTEKGNHARGRLNQRQIDVVFEEIIPQQNIDCKTQSVGIISPYRLQTDEMKKTIGNLNIEVNTVHKFQGREKDVIILTTVANEIAVDDFVDNPNLINVAVSRAVDKLIVVVSEGVAESQGTNLGDLIRYIQYNNFEIIQSQLYSVFDLLYSRFSEKLLDFMKNSKNVSEFKSENLMNIVIEKVLSEPEFQTFDRVLHQPLKMLIKDPVKLNDEQCKFAMNILTHTDFVIFNKLDKSPVLVVEVDGYAYHASNEKQLKRDRMKDEILRKYEIPILRIGTNESGEEGKLREKLRLK